VWVALELELDLALEQLTAIMPTTLTELNC
jgi:hypothetical protein